MQKILSFIDRYDPDFRGRILGASPEEIDALEEVTGHVLPPDYRDYLSVMGRTDAGLLSQPGIWTDVSSLLSFYRENVASGEASVPKDCITIAVSGLVIEQLYLECGGLGRIFEGDDGQKCSLWAASLHHLIHQNAYMSYRQRSLPHTRVYTGTGNTNIALAVRRVVRSTGLLELDISDTVTLCAESSATTLAFRQIAGQTAWVRVAGADGAAVSYISERLERACPVTMEGIA